MNIELYEGNKSLYVCAVNSAGGCMAVRVFDLETGASKDNGTESLEGIAREIAVDPASWEHWNGGSEIPGLMYEREIISAARLAAHYDGGDHWHIDKPVSAMRPAARTFLSVHSAALAATDRDGCEDRRIDGSEDQAGMVLIGRPINGISLNGLDWLLNDDGSPMRFRSEDAARAFLYEKGISDTDIEDEGIVFMQEADLEADE